MTKAKHEIPPDQRFVETFAVVRDCSHNEQFMLWRWWHLHLGVPWEDQRGGMYAQIGELDKRPICVLVSWALIVGKRVAFVEATSQVVDAVVVDAWARAVFPNAKASADAANFHNVLGPIADALGIESLVRRDPEAVDHAAANLPERPEFMRAAKSKVTS